MWPSSHGRLKLESQRQKAQVGARARTGAATEALASGKQVYVAEAKPSLEAAVEIL